MLVRRFSNIHLKYTQVTPTLEAAMGKEGGGNVPMLLVNLTNGDAYELPENHRSADGE